MVEQCACTPAHKHPGAFYRLASPVDAVRSELDRHAIAPARPTPLAPAPRHVTTDDAPDWDLIL